MSKREPHVHFTRASPSGLLADGLAAGEVHLWRAHLREGAASLRRGTLPPDELERANRMLRADHRAEFVFSRDVLRTVLAAYLCTDASRLVFATSGQGKPSLASHSIEFNLSSCRGGVLLAIAGDRSVGIDLECCERNVDIDALADACLTQSERRAFFALALPLRKAWLLQLWTRKEALLKGMGYGLACDPREVDVWWPAADSIADHLWEHEPAWTLIDVAPGRGWRAAVAVAAAEAPNLRGFCLGW